MAFWVLKNPCQLTFIFTLISSQVASAIAIVCSAQYLSISIIKMFRAISLARNGLKDPSWALIHLEHILFLSSLCLPMQEKQETQVWSLSQEDTLEKKMATRSSILSWTIPWTEEPGKLQSTGWQRVGHNWACITLLMSPNVSLKHNFLSAIFRRWKKFNLSQNMVPCKHYSQNSPAQRPWCWERLRAGGQGSNRAWDGWMASPTQWTWVWANSGRQWRMGKPGVLQLMGSRRVRHDWATEQ